MQDSFGFPLEAVVILFVTVAVSVWIDLYAHRNDSEVSFKDAAVWSLAWTLLAIGFYFYLKYRFSDEAASLFLSGYALERSLSIDNMMVFVAIFASFGITGILQYRILYYGIIGALVFRALFVGAGTALFALGAWVELLFAAVVLWSAWALLKGGENEAIRDYSGHWSVRLTSRLLPVVPRLVGKKFIVNRASLERLQASDPDLRVRRPAAYYVTPAILCLVCIEISDVVFSFDSVPAIIAVTREPLLVYAAVIYAVVGLRSLYFMLVVAARYLRHLDKAVALILVFVAVKLAASAMEGAFGMRTFHLSHVWSLWVVLGLLGLGVLASVLFPGEQTREEDEDVAT